MYKYHQIRLEGALMKSLVQPPAAEAGSAVRSELVVQGIVHSSLEDLEGWTLHSQPVQPLSLPACPQDENISSFIQLEPHLFQLLLPPILYLSKGSTFFY